MSRRNRIIVTLALVSAVGFGVLIALRLCGLLIPFSIPTSAMAPAVSAGDHVIMEGFTFLSRPPRRGDVVVFERNDNASMPLAKKYVKRVAGEPGDRVRISGGKLFVNDQQVSLSNSVGEIVFDLPPHHGSFSLQTDVTVPPECYYVLGDNLATSSDSRFWGSIPRENIIGRVSPRNRKLALKWWLEAAKRGHPKAQCNLAVAFENGSGTRQDFTKAMKWYRKSVKSGDRRAASNMKRLSRYLSKRQV